MVMLSAHIAPHHLPTQKKIATTIHRGATVLFGARHATELVEEFLGAALSNRGRENTHFPLRFYLCTFAKSKSAKSHTKQALRASAPR